MSFSRVTNGCRQAALTTSRSTRSRGATSPKARTLLAAAGQPNPAVELLIPNTPELLQAGQVIQSMAQEAGFQVSLKAVEATSLINLATKGQYQARLGGWSGRIDPDGNFYNFIACKAPLNDNGYCNQDVDGALDGDAHDSRSGQRLTHYRAVADHTLQDLPLIYLWHNKWFWAATPKLKRLYARIPTA